MNKPTRYSCPPKWWVIWLWRQNPYLSTCLCLYHFTRKLRWSIVLNIILLEQADSIPALIGKFAWGRRLNVFNALQFAYVQQISGVTLYSDDNKTTLFASGQYHSWSSCYLEWWLSEISWNVDQYIVEITTPDNTTFITWTILTGIVLPLSWGDGIYTLSVTPISSDKNLTWTSVSTSLAIDNLPPTAHVVYSPTSGTRTSGTVIATLTWRSESISWITQYTFTGNWSFLFTFVDGAGTTWSALASVDRIDATFPTFTWVTDDSVYSWSITITYADNVSWVLAYLSGELYTGWTISTDGSYSFVVRDLAGNSTWADFTLDTTAPSIALVSTTFGYRNQYLSWTPSIDNRQSIVIYTYAFTQSWSNDALFSGILVNTWVAIPITGNWYYTFSLMACDDVHNCATSLTSTILINWPTPFSFASQANAELQTAYISSSTTMTGLITWAIVEIQWWQYSINSWARQSTSGIIFNGDEVNIRLTSSSSYITSVQSILSIWWLTGTFVVTTKTNPNTWGWGGGGWWGGGSLQLATPTCTLSHLVCRSWVYTLSSWSLCAGWLLGASCSLGSGAFSGNNWSLPGWIGSPLTPSTAWSSFSLELTTAYLYAYAKGITTMPSIVQANLTGTLIRKHLAKMISNFAIKELWLSANTGMVCDFDDMRNETTEMKFYANLACQLGLMWLDANGTPVKNFNPDIEVTRAQFGTVLSRALRGDMYNGWSPYYLFHLNQLQQAKIMKKIDTPESQELRWYVMLMLMRSAE